MKKKKPASRMKRPVHRMPPEIREALNKRGVMKAYKARPTYQQNDYIGWITRAKLPSTRLRRALQMLDELEKGKKYMNMAYKPKQKKK